VSARTDKMKVGMFIRPAGHHIASWRHPQGHADAGANFARMVEIAQTAERGLLDMVFCADTHSVFTAHEQGLHRLHCVAWIEPFTMLAALASYTKNIGLVCTASTSFEQPYTVARKFASLDLVSGGRSGWNVVTSGNATEALNFSNEPHKPKDERYRRGKEFVEVVQALWDSWDDDAFLRDKEACLFFDPNKMHTLNHHGEYFDVRGPLNVPRSPQGQPVLVQAGASDDGRELAAQTAEVVFTARDVAMTRSKNMTIRQLYQWFARQRGHPIRVDQHELRDESIILGRDFGGDPAAERAADDGNILQRELVDDIEHHVGDVVGSGDPIGPVGTTKARRRRDDDFVGFGELVEKRCVALQSLFAGQEQQGRTVSATLDLKLQLVRRSDLVKVLRGVFLHRHALGSCRQCLSREPGRLSNRPEQASAYSHTVAVALFRRAELRAYRLCGIGKPRMSRRVGPS
jgi:alkanesulfonate monooxygenase SsuD/methylene tetrahydromethanopterin reductase-like flavin-dependent oxidoreductase (luciferase family)